MRRKDELNYFETEWKELKSALKTYYKDRKPEDLHKFRVQVKKLHAFITLVESDLDSSRLKKRFKPVRGIFKKAGEIRDAYLHEQLTRKMKLGQTGILKEQQEIQQKAGTEFEAGKKEFLKELKEVRRELKKRIKPVADIHIRLYYDHLLRQAGEWLAQPTFDKALHGCRKLMKILIYNHKLVHQVIDHKFNERYLETIQTAIGEWHDQALAMEFFSRRGVNEKAALARLKKDDARLKAEVRKLGKDFYKKATTKPLHQSLQ